MQSSEMGETRRTPYESIHAASELQHSVMESAKLARLQIEDPLKSAFESAKTMAEMQRSAMESVKRDHLMFERPLKAAFESVKAMAEMQRSAMESMKLDRLKFEQPLKAAFESVKAMTEMQRSTMESMKLDRLKFEQPLKAALESIKVAEDVRQSLIGAFRTVDDSIRSPFENGSRILSETARDFLRLTTKAVESLESTTLKKSPFGSPSIDASGAELAAHQPTDAKVADVDTESHLSRLESLLNEVIVRIERLENPTIKAFLKAQMVNFFVNILAAIAFTAFLQPQNQILPSTLPINPPTEQKHQDAPRPQTNPAPKRSSRTVTPKRLRVFQRPNFKATSLGSLRVGESVTVLDTWKKWARVKREGNLLNNSYCGWVLKKYLA